MSADPTIPDTILAVAPTPGDRVVYISLDDGILRGVVDRVEYTVAHVTWHNPPLDWDAQDELPWVRQKNDGSWILNPRAAWAK